MHFAYYMHVTWQCRALTAVRSRCSPIHCRAHRYSDNAAYDACLPHCPLRPQVMASGDLEARAIEALEILGRSAYLHQREALRAQAARHDVLLCAATGAGKSATPTRSAACRFVSTAALYEQLGRLRS